MKRCPITYEVISDQKNYSQRGLKLFSPQLKQLKFLEYTVAEQHEEAIARASKMSLQGVQLKLSARLKVTQGCFEIVDNQGHYILKPQSDLYLEVPENEALTMSLAKMIGIEIPVHGLIYAKDNSLAYVIKRFDRIGHKQKLAQEDFTQLLQLDRNSKYDGSMEKVAKVIYSFCSFPKIEAVKLFNLTLFNFLVGNDDMHLKNFSLITRDQKIILSPAYDLLNTNILNPGFTEELALPLKGKKKNLKKQDFIDYYGTEVLKLNQAVIQSIIQNIQLVLPAWQNLIENSFMSPSMKEKYLTLLNERAKRLGFEIIDTQS